MSNYRYYRFQINYSDGGIVSIGNIQLQESLGGVDVTSGNTPVFESSANSSTERGSEVVNNSNSSEWVSSDVAPQWITIDIGSNVNITHFTMQSQRVCCSGRTPSIFKLYGSTDALNWEHIGSYNETNWGILEERSFVVGDGLSTFSISGVTQVQGVESPCIVRAYNRTTGQLASSTIADNITGTYTLANLEGAIEYDVICLSDVNGICPQVSGPLQATDIV